MVPADGLAGRDSQSALEKGVASLASAVVLLIACLHVRFLPAEVQYASAGCHHL